MIIAKNATLADGSSRILASIPFSSVYKKGFTAMSHPTLPNLVRVYGKGAPDYLLPSCSHMLDEHNHQAELTAHKRSDIMLSVIKEKFAKQAYRTLLIAYKDFTLTEFENHIKHRLGNANIEDDIKVLEKDLTLIGIYGLQDPLRDEIPDSVKMCKAAGITIRMVTGDNLDTAVAIAKEAGILTEDEAYNGTKKYAFMEGLKFRELVKIKKVENDGEKTEEVLENPEQFKAIAA